MPFSKFENFTLVVKIRNPQKFDANSLVEQSITNGTFDFNVQKPISWQVSAAELGTESDLYYRLASGTSGVGIKNEDFVTWMRTSPLPTFKKLYRRVALPSGWSRFLFLPNGWIQGYVPRLQPLLLEYLRKYFDFGSIK